MKFAIAFLICLVISLVLLIVGWRKRPIEPAQKLTVYGMATLSLGIAAVLLAIPAVTAPFSLVLAGIGLIAGVLAFNARDNHRLTIIGQVILAIAVLFWLVFLIAELIFPH